MNVGYSKRLKTDILFFGMVKNGKMLTDLSTNILMI